MQLEEGAHWASIRQKIKISNLQSAGSGLKIKQNDRLLVKCSLGDTKSLLVGSEQVTQMFCQFAQTK